MAGRGYRLVSIRYDVAARSQYCTAKGKGAGNCLVLVLHIGLDRPKQVLVGGKCF